MTAFSALVPLLLLIVAGADAQVQMTGRHNAKISEELHNYNNDNYIIEMDVVIPDVVINKYHDVKGDNIKDRLMNFVKAAADEFALKLRNDYKAANGLVADVDSSRIGQQQPSSSTDPSIKKRSAMIPDDVDVEGTKALYEQTLEFLEKYDVELRLQ